MVREVAEQVGFRTTAAFQQAFARWTRLSPSDYRKRVQAEVGATTAQAR